MNDGCEDQCARGTLEAAGLPPDLHLDVTTLGIPKKPERPDLIGDSRRVAGRVAGMLDRGVGGEEGP